jgi:hypothetical protein
MLLLERSIDTPEATLYADDLEELRWFVLPKVPILRQQDGKAIFKYVKYRTLKPMANGDIGAALVFMDVELALTQKQEDELRKQLVDRLMSGRAPNDGRPPIKADQIILSKPQVTKAEVKVEVLAASGSLVQRVNHAGKPSMYGNNVVALSAELSQLGAPVFEAVMKSQGAGGVRVVYDMSFPARLPSVKVDATWRAEKFYSFFQQVDVNERFWSDDDYNERISEMFTNSESRQVVIDPGSLSRSDPAVAQMLDTLRASIEQQLDAAVQRNLLEAIPPESRDISKIRQEGFEHIKRDVSVNKISDVAIHFRERQVATVEVLPQANMPSLVSQNFKWEDYAIEADTDDPFFRQLNLTIQVNADFENLPIFSVDVTIDYPPEMAKRGKQTFSFRKADDIGKFNAFIEGGSAKFKYQYVVNYKGESRVFTSREIDHEGNDLKINVDELGLWLVDVEVGDMNFDLVSHAMLTLEHPEISPGVPPVSKFQIDKDTRKFQVKEVLLAPVQPYKATLKFFMKDGREFVRELPGQNGHRFYVDDPFSVTKVVQLRSRGDFEKRIDSIFVDLVYDDDVNKYRQTSSIALSKDKRFFDWSFPVIDERVGTVKAHVNTIYKDGTQADAGDKELKGTTLVVGEEVATLSVRIVPDLIDFKAVKLAMVEIRYVDDDPVHKMDEHKSFIFRTGAAEALYELAIHDQTKKSYTWKAEFFMNDGRKKESASPTPVTSDTLFVEMPA